MEDTNPYPNEAFVPYFQTEDVQPLPDEVHTTTTYDDDNLDLLYAHIDEIERLREKLKKKKKKNRKLKKRIAVLEGMIEGAWKATSSITVN